MIEMDLADETTALAWIVDRILDLNCAAVRIVPDEQVPVADLDLASVSDEVDPVIGRAEIPCRPTLRDGDAFAAPLCSPTHARDNRIFAASHCQQAMQNGRSGSRPSIFCTANTVP